MKRIKIRSQIDSLLKLQGNDLNLFAANLDLPDNVVRQTVPEYMQAICDLEGFKLNGLGSKHPVVKDQAAKIETMKRQIDEGILDLRHRLNDQLDHLPNQPNAGEDSVPKSR